MSSAPPPARPRVGAEPLASSADSWKAFLQFQVVFWGLFFLMRALAAAEVNPELLAPYMIPRGLIVLAYAASTTCIHAILLRFAHWRTSRGLLLLLALSFVVMAPMHALEVTAARLVTPETVGTIAFLDYVSRFGWAILLWSGYYLARQNSAEAQAHALALSRALAQARAAEMRMLRYQLNPHFLFNSLNAISTLVLEKRNADAEAMIMRLSRFLRHTVNIDPDQFSPLGDEVEIQKLYLDIEAERFGDRLHVICDVPEKLFDCMVPSLLIQPAVENAIKHGVSQRASGGVIRIAVRACGDRLIMVVEDNGPGPAARVTAVGVGLRNMRERLEASYGDDASVTLAARPEGGARVTFDIPLRRSAQRAPQLETQRGV